jgi:hypothetical protein
MKIRTGLAVSAVALAALLGSPGAASADEPGGDTPPTHTAEFKELPPGSVDVTDAVVVHWGPGFASKPLDASIPENRDPQQSVPAALDPQFVCSTYVGKVTRPANLYSYTQQTCTGMFVNQWTNAKFVRSSWTGWRDYTGWTRGSSTSSTINDSGWDAPCDAGDGTYDYALQAIGHARAYDGTDVGGPLLTGNSGRYNCGT